MHLLSLTLPVLHVLLSGTVCHTGTALAPWIERHLVSRCLVPLLRTPYYRTGQTYVTNLLTNSSATSISLPNLSLAFPISRQTSIVAIAIHMVSYTMC